MPLATLLLAASRLERAEVRALPSSHNGGVLERLISPTVPTKRPHIVMLLFDDFGWADAGWHRGYTIGGVHVPPTREVATPTLDALVRDGIEFDRHYVYAAAL